MTIRALFLAAMLTVLIGGVDPARGNPAPDRLASFAYVASPVRRKANFAAIVNEYRKTAPDAAAQLDTLLASTDVVALLQKGMTPFGLRTDNVADCYAVWWVSQWLASRGRHDTPSRQQMLAVKAQAASAMASVPALAATNNDQKQELADSLLFQTLLTEILMDQGKSSPEALRAAAAMAATNTKMLGLDLATIELTATGFSGAGQAASSAPTAVVRAPASIRAPATKRAAAAAPAVGPVGLVGMWRSDWVENQFRAFAGLTLVALNNTLVFTRGGYFIDGVPEGAGFDDAGAQTVIARDPKLAGRYVVQPGKITLNYADGHSETVDAKRQGNSWILSFKGRFMSSKLLFPDGATLSGLYTNERISNAGGGIFVVGDRDFSFAPDGRFARGSRVSMSAPAFSSRDGGERNGGRYRVAGSALILDYTDGRRETLSLFQETRGEAIWLDDTMYKPAR